MRLHAAALALVLCSSPTWAQSVYKCGSTYSQTPCAHDAKEVGVSNNGPVSSSASAVADIQAAQLRAKKQAEQLGNPPNDPEQIKANKIACLTAIRSLLKDPDSARIGDFTRSEGYETDYAGGGNLILDPSVKRGTWFPALLYSLPINAKNSYGGYTGNKLYSCSFDVTDKRLLKVRFD